MKQVSLLIQIAIFAVFAHKKLVQSSICDMCDMKRYLRRVAKRNDRVFSYTISIPVKLVLELGLSDSMVELKN